MAGPYPERVPRSWSAPNSRICVVRVKSNGRLNTDEDLHSIYNHYEQHEPAVNAVLVHGTLMNPCVSMVGRLDVPRGFFFPRSFSVDRTHRGAAALNRKYPRTRCLVENLR